MKKMIFLCVFLLLLIAVFTACTDEHEKQSETASLPVPIGQTSEPASPASSNGSDQTVSPPEERNTDNTETSPPETQLITEQSTERMTEPMTEPATEPETEEDVGLVIESEIIEEVTGNVGIGGT